jgi:predicted phosphoribosyltransferase
MSWKRAQLHAESMLLELGLSAPVKGKKDLRGKQIVLVDDGQNQYRTMCFTIAAKIVRRRGGEVVLKTPDPGEQPHAKIVEIARPQPAGKGPRPGRGLNNR